MAIDSHSIRFLREARESAVCFASTVTLGCQSMAGGPETLAAFAGVAGSAEPVGSRTLFRAFGCTEFHEMDRSNYEGADITQDLNAPLRAELAGKFDVVFDGGTLEHVFNVAEGLRSCMRMVKVGGHFIGHSPANNWFGHGFYQFSPEFFFRSFSPENGFEIRRLVAYETAGAGEWYDVRDPRDVGERIELMGPLRAMLLVLARKTRDAAPFATFPAQSDYSAAWAASSGPSSAANPAGPAAVRTRLRALIDRLPAKPGRVIRALIAPLIHRAYSLENTRHFTPVHKR